MVVLVTLAAGGMVGGGLGRAGRVALAAVENGAVTLWEEIDVGMGSSCTIPSLRVRTTPVSFASFATEASTPSSLAAWAMGCGESSPTWGSVSFSPAEGRARPCWRRPFPASTQGAGGAAPAGGPRIGEQLADGGDAAEDT